MMGSAIDVMSIIDLVVGVIGGITVIAVIVDRTMLNSKHIVFLEKIINIVLCAMVGISVLTGILIIIKILITARIVTNTL